MAHREVEDIYRLSPVQQGMLFHALFEPGGVAYFEQFAYEQTGALDRERLLAAWRHLLAREPILRTAFVWEGLDEPVQVVRRRVELPVVERDLRGLGHDEQRRRVAAYLEEDRARGFDLGTAPLARISLLHLGDERTTVVLSYHHLLLDGWSTTILLRDVAGAYEALGRGEEPDLPARRPFRDYVAWLNRQDLDAARQYWARALAGFEAPTPLPGTGDGAAPGGEAAHGQRTCRLSASATTALREVARRHEVTLATLVQAAWALTLARHAGTADATLGVTVSGRPAGLQGVDGMIGCFINTLPLRLPVPATGGIGAWLREVRARQAELARFEYSPLAEIRRWAGIPGERPLFDAILVFQNFDGGGGERNGVDRFNRTHYPLTLVAVPERELSFLATFRSDVLPAAAAGRLLGHLRGVLERLAADPATVGELAALPPAEEHALRREWNDTATHYPGAKRCLHELIAVQAERTPGATAVWFEGRSLTYRELDRRADRLAWRLRALGVGPETLVGLCAERSLELVVGLLAILKAGGAYVPLDPSYPSERLAFMLEDSRIAVLLAGDGVATALPEHGAQVVPLAGSADPPPAGEEAPASAGPPPSGAGPENLAYVIFTSGSTGRPKGAMNRHRGIVNRLLWMQGEYLLDPSDRVLQKTPFSFDVSVWELFWPLLAGARLVVARPGGHQDGAYLARLIAEQGVTTIHFVPSMLQVFLEEPGVAACGSLRRVIASGEALPRDLVERFYERLPGREGEAAARLHNLYGPTEAAVDVTYRPTEPGGRGPVPIGRPVANTHLLVLGRDGRPVPAGAPGELCLGGRQVGRGYFARPALTAARFVPDPTAGRPGPAEAAPGAHVYRTGDLACWRPDGAVEFLGRIDFQIKLRGFRIELGEIEAALAGHPAVREAAVVAREREPGDVRLVAYAVPAAGEAPASSDLRAHLGRSLPEYMVPSAIVLLVAMPLTPSGKLDRRALPDPPDAGASAREHEAPRTPTEEILASLWSQVLGVERVGRHDDFFELGGHSLLATRLLWRVRDAFRVELPLRSLFDRSTLAGSAALIDAARGGEGAGAGESPPIPILPRDGEAPFVFPQSFSQERLWFLDRLHPGSAAYNIPSAVRLAGELDEVALVAALGEVAARHEILRTTFGTEGDRPVQRVRAPGGGMAGLPVERVDLSGEGGPATALERAAELVRDRARRPFDLERGPLGRAVLVRLGPRDHVLGLTLHHIVSDGWSAGVLVRELAALYAARAQVGEGVAALPPLPVQYADFSAWQRDRLSGARLAGELEHWRRRLAGAPDLLALPLDRPRPAVQTYRGEVESRTFDEPVHHAMTALGRAEGATRFVVLLAGLAALLGRYSGQDDLTVGAPVAGRDRPELEGLIGLFVNTLVLRADLAGGIGFRDLLARLRETVLDAHAHQELPFERLVEALAPRREVSHSPLFQVMLAFQDRPEPIAAPGLTLAPFAAGTGTSKFDLTLYAADLEDRMEVSAEYNPDLFDRPTIARLLGHLEGLLAAAAAAPARVLADLAILSDAERRQLAAWNGTAAAYAGAATLHERLAAQARATPDAVAVVSAGDALSYRELAARAGRLAGRLQAAGVGPDSLVGVAAERSPELMVALLAVLAAGGAYVPLDPSYPAERLAAMIEDAHPPVILAQPGLLDRLPGVGSAVIELPPGGDVGQSAPVRPPPALADALAYTIFTSGSTGRPKGVMNRHAGIVNRLAWMQETLGLGPGDRVLQKTPASFDVSVWELFWPLLTGAALVMARPEGHKDPAYLAATVVRERVTTLHFVPSMLQAFLEARGVETCRDLRRVIASGEALAPDLVERYYQRLEAPLHNLYGPTEAAVDVTHWPTSPGAGALGVPIGHPVANTRIHVVDPGGREVPVGVPGELRIGGVQVARGYAGRPALSAERFVPDPFAETPGSRLYRTGDLARWLAAGEVAYLGRIDHQVKVRGFRIELGEIEAALADLPAVREATVLALGAGEERRLVAYVVAAGGAGSDPPTLEGVRRGLASRVPEYMLPSALVVLDAMPLTPSGKVDRRALPAPEHPAASHRHVAPRTPAEETIAGIWAEVLGAERVGVEDDFFLLGGHSLLGARVVSRVAAAFGVDLPLMTLFRSPTVAGLAAAVEGLTASGEGTGHGPRAIPRAPRTGPLPLSYAQERLWFLDRFEPESPLYNLPSGLRVRGPLDAAALEGALDDLAARHETLRTTFAETASWPVQVIAAEGRLPLARIDLSRLPAARREAAARRLARRAGRRPFDLARGPLARALLLRLAPEEHEVHLTVHHAASDGASERILVRDLLVLYARRVGRAERAAAPALPELPVQYADFAAWQRAHLSGARLEAEVAHWRERLAGAPELLELPADRPRPPAQTFRGGARPVRLPRALTGPLRRAARARGATPFMTLLAAYAALLGRLTGQDDVVVGTPVEGRFRPELEELVGFFVNTLALRIDLAGEPGFGELAERARRATLEGYDHQQVPFEKLVAELRPTRNLAYSPLFQVMLIVQPAVTEPAVGRALGLELARANPGTGVSKFDLTLNLFDNGTEVGGQWAYSADLFDPATVDRLTRGFETLLAAGLAAPQVPLARLPLLAAEERQQVLVDWNAPAVEHPRGGSVQRMVAEQAARTPDAVAVVFEGEHLSYGELDRRAGRLARRLRAAGVGPEVVAGVLAERSVDLPAALLAVLRAGGAYLPLDPQLPADRLRFLLADARVRVVLAPDHLTPRLAEVVPGEGAPRRIPLAADEGPDAAPEPDELPDQVPPEQAAYVIYTSGSTGRPKGAVVPHGPLANRLQYARAVDVGPLDGFLQKTTISFDVSVLEIFGPLVAGGRTVLPRPGGEKDTAYLVDLVGRERLTQTSFPPTLLFALLEEPRFRELSSLRTVITGGETVAPELPGRFHRHLAADLLNRYGPTEATISVTSWRCRPEARERALPIGRPTAGARVYVFDRRLEPLPVGVPGEVCLGGPCVARGLPRPAGQDRRELRARPFRGRRGSGGSDVPHRRPGPLAHRRRARVRRPGRHPGEDPRLPRRAGRDRGRDRPPPRGARGGGGGTRRGGRPPAGRLLGSGRGGGGGRRRSRGPGRRRAAGAHGAFHLRASRRAAADPDRQGRPCGAPRAGARGGSVGPAGRAAARSGGGDRRRPLAGPPGDRVGLPPRRLLRPGRPLAPRDPGGLAPAPGVRGRAAPAAPVRGADGGRSGAGRRRGPRPRRGPRTRDRGPPALGRRRLGLGRAAALLRPGAALVPRPHGRRERGLQPDLGAAPRRAPGSGGPDAGLQRPGAPARDPPDGVRLAAGPRRRRRRPAPADPSSRAGGRPGDRSRRSAARAPGARASGSRGPRRPPPARPRARPAGPRPPGAPGPGRSRGAADPAPHRLGRLVAGDPGAGAHRALPGGAGRRAGRASGAAGAVRRLRRLAARVAHRRGAGAAARLLAGSARGGQRGPRPADRPAAAAGPDVARRRRRRRPGRGTRRAPRRARAAARRDPLHGRDGRLSGAPRAPHRAGRPDGGDHHRRPLLRRDRRVDRLLRQHPRPARRPLRRPRLRHRRRAGTGGEPRRLRAPGPAVREAGRGAPPAARPLPSAALPGADAAPERPGRTARAAGPDRAPGAARQRHRQVRPDPQPVGSGRGAPRPLALQDRPVRPDHGRAAGPPPRQPARRRRRGPGAAGLGARDARPGRAPPAGPRAGGRGMAGAGRGRPGHARPALPRAGVGGAGRGRGDLRRVRPVLWRALGARPAPGRRASAARRRPGCGRGDLPRPLARHRGRDPRRPRGGRRLPAARSGLPGGTARVHSRGQPGAGGDHPEGPRRPAGRAGRGGYGGCPGPVPGRGAGGRFRHRSGERSRRPRRRRVRHLHLGLDRPAQGGARPPPQCHPAVRGHRRLVRLRSGRRLDPLSFLRLRLLGLGALGRAPLRRPPRGRAPRREPVARGLPRAAGARAGDGPQPDALGVPPAGARRRLRPRGARRLARGGLRRRGPRAREPGALVRALRRRAAAPGEHVRHHRDHGARDLPADPAPGPRDRSGKRDRAADSRSLRPPPRSARSAGSDRRRG